jgi:hypothetical protein
MDINKKYTKCTATRKNTVKISNITAGCRKTIYKIKNVEKKPTP